MFLITAKSIFQLFLLIVSGMLAYKTGIVKKDGLKAINGVLLHLALPATLLKSFQMEILFENRMLLGTALGLTVIYQVLPILLSFVLIRKNPDAGVERASVAFTNNAFIAIPLLTAIFGEIGTFYSSASNVISSILVWTVIPMMLTGEFSVKTFIKKVCNDKIAVCVFAFILLMLNVRLPELILTPVDYLSAMTSPLAMISIGIVIASSDIRKIFTKRIIWISFLRLVVTTLIICAVLRLIVKDETTFLCFCVLSAAPSGSLITILAEEAGMNTDKASGIFMMTTIACSVTIPLLVLLLTGGM